MLVAYSAWAMAVLLAALPIAHNLIFGRHERRREIVDFFDSKSILEYFERFYHARFDQLKSDPEGQLEFLYDHRFGLRTFILPLVCYIPALVLAVTAIVSVAVQPVFGVTVSFASNNALIAYALAGAYLWVVSDLLIRWRQRDIGPDALFNWTFRLIISIPIALTMAIVVRDNFAAPAAFLLGVFPTKTLLTFLRRQAADKLKLGDNVDDSKNELEVLEGINTTIAEKFADIGVTTLVRLAYEDPIQLAMRLNLPFIFILDVVSQALVGMYFKDLEITRRYSIRGSIEAFFLYEDLQIGDNVEKARAEKIRDDMAADLKISPQTLEKILSEIAEDPATKFLKELPY